MPMTAILGNVVLVPLRDIPAATMDRVVSDLTINYKVMGERAPQTLETFYTVEGYLAVPRAYGLQLISKLGLEYEDQTSPGKPYRFPKNVVHTGNYEYQDAFVRDILAASERHTDFLVHAATGKGKTVCSLSVVQKRGRTALIVVDQDNLMQQWVGEAQSILGLPRSAIGIVQGDKCEYKGKAVVVAMIHSLTRRDYPEEFYDYFGTVVFDEAHTVGAPTFSQALGMFSAEVRFGVSATIDRRDALQALIHQNLGQVAVALLDKHESSYVYYIESDTVYSDWANRCDKPAPMLAEVCNDGERNRKIVDGILWLYETGRDTLVISDRIEQLENLQAMAYYAGIPYEDTGLYCGERNVLSIAETTDKRGNARSALVLTRVKIKKSELQEVKTKARVVFATYGMFSKGVDVPRLSGGIDVSPRTRAQQVHGRILRKQDDKLVPIWVTIRDVNSFRLESQFANRLGEYVASSAEIYKWRPEINGVRLQDVKALTRKVRESAKRLKRLHTITCVDGSFTLVTQPTRKEPRERPVRATERRTR